MYYPEESFDPPPMVYGVDSGANDVVGGRSQNMGHGMGHHHAPLFISPHMMNMPSNAYMPAVSSTHQMHMPTMNVHSHLSSSSGSTLRSSSELPILSYPQPQSSTISHRNAPVFHTTQPQQATHTMPPSSGPSAATSTSQPRVHVPLSSGNLSSQWSWPPPMATKAPQMTTQHSHMSNVQTPSPSNLPHTHTMSSVASKSSAPTATGAWAGPPPRSLLSSSGPAVNDSRFRAPVSSSSGGQGKYLPGQGAGQMGGGGMGGSGGNIGGGGGRNAAPKSVASFVASNAKVPFYNYTPSNALTASGSMGAGGSSGVASFSDASVYVPSSHGSSHGGSGGHGGNAQAGAHGHHHSGANSMHASSQHLTSSHHHISRPNPMDEYIAASLRRRVAKQLSQLNGTTTGTAGVAGSAPATPAPNGSTSSASGIMGQQQVRAGSPAVSGGSKDSHHHHHSKSVSNSASGQASSNSVGASIMGSPSKANLAGSGLLSSTSSLSLLASNPSLMSSSNIAAATNSTTDTVNWQVLDLSGMELCTVSPLVANYAQISVLYLQHNRLVSLPVELCSLQQLKFLDLSHNQLAWLPAEIGQLLNLKELILSHNQLRGLPIEIGKLFRLNELMIEENPITDIPIEILAQGAAAVVAHLRTMLAPTEPPPPRSWLLSSSADRSTAMPGYFHGLDALLGPKSVRTLEGTGHKQVAIQSKDVAKFRIEGSVRTMTYNILADIYASSLNYCPSWALNWNHRKAVVMKEIDTYNPDLLCLQEVVWAQYLSYFQPELEARGYKGVFHPKTRIKYSADLNRVDGCASFYRASMFDQVDFFNVEFQTIAQENADRYCSAEDDAGYVRLCSKDNIGVGLVLRRKDRVALLQQQQQQQARAASMGTGGKAGNGAQNRRTNSVSPAPPSALPSPEEDLLVFVNTHIHWDPDFSDVKLMQVQILLEQLEAWVDEYSTPQRRIPVVLGGDFNSMPDSGVYQLLIEGFVAGNHADFLGYSYGDYTDSGLKHSLPLMSANASLAGEPSFTNYTGDFNGVLDYIWYSDDCLVVERALLGVDESVVHAYNGALPNPHMPSDHIPLVTDFVQNMNRRG